MIQVFKTDEQYVKWLNGQTLPSGIVVYVSDDETMYFSTNNIKGELKTYKCEKEEVIDPSEPTEPTKYPPLVYSAKSAGSTIEVNGETVILEQGDNIELNYANEITSVKAINNTALTYIQIPNTVVSINDNAFTGCTELTDFRYNGTVEEWGAITLGTDWNKDAAFTVVHCTDGDVTLEEPIQPIQPNNLVYSTNAAGSTIKVNGQSMTLEQGDNIVLDYPSEITSVKASNNTALTYIKIPNTVTSINGYAFKSCSSLASITIPETVASIGIGAFYECAALASITIPSGVTSIGSWAFNGCAALTYIQIPNMVTSIDDYVFSGCSALASITIPETVTSIGVCTFYECAALASITIPSGVTSIGNWAFRDCSSLGSITIPETVTSIGNAAFMNCSALTDFNYNGTKAQWSSITLGDEWKDNAGFSQVHCTDGDVTLL